MPKHGSCGRPWPYWVSRRLGHSDIGTTRKHSNTTTLRGSARPPLRRIAVAKLKRAAAHFRLADERRRRRLETTDAAERLASCGRPDACARGMGSGRLCQAPHPDPRATGAEARGTGTARHYSGSRVTPVPRLPQERGSRSQRLVAAAASCQMAGSTTTTALPAITRR